MANYRSCAIWSWTPDRVKARQLHDAMFREERVDLFAVWDCCEDLLQE
jgi:hypothetical protein